MPRRKGFEREHRLELALVKVYGPQSVQGHVGIGDFVAREGLRLSDAGLYHLRLAHSCLEYDGVHQITDAEEQKRDRLRHCICKKARLPLYRLSRRPSVGTVLRTAKSQAEDQTSLQARRLAGVLATVLGNGLGLVLWWQAGQYAQPGVSQHCWGPLVVAALGWTEGGSPTLLCASLLAPCMFVAPLVSGIYLI